MFPSSICPPLRLNTSQLSSLHPSHVSQRNPQCFGHTWYLGDDMMYFLTVPWLVVLYRHGGLRKTLSILLTLGVVVGCMIYNG